MLALKPTTCRSEPSLNCATHRIKRRALSLQPGMAGFSSRGPNDHPHARFRMITTGRDAPGVSIWGPPTPTGVRMQRLGWPIQVATCKPAGTSFATPITARTMALIRQRVRDLGLDTTNLLSGISINAVRHR